MVRSVFGQVKDISRITCCKSFNVKDAICEDYSHESEKFDEINFIKGSDVLANVSQLSFFLVIWRTTSRVTIIYHNLRV